MNKKIIKSQSGEISVDNGNSYHNVSLLWWPNERNFAHLQRKWESISEVDLDQAHLTRWGWNKMANILQVFGMRFWLKTFLCLFKCQLMLFC